MPIGQRIDVTNPSYILTPGTGSDVADGKQLSASDAMILQQNGSQLSSVNWPNIGQIVGPGLITGYDPGQYGTGFAGLTDYGPPPTLVEGDIHMCPFQIGVSCVAFGPFALPGVALSTNPSGYKLPELHVWVHAHKGTRGSSPDHLYVWALLMRGMQHPLEADPLIVAAPTIGNPVSTAVDYELQLKINDGVVIQDNAEWTSRPSAEFADRNTRLFACSLWVGWYTTNNNGTAANKDAIYSVSAFVLPKQS